MCLKLYQTLLGIPIVSQWSLGLLIHKIMSSENRSNLASSFPVCIPLEFSFLMCIDKSYKTISSSRGERGLPCLVLDLSKNAFKFSPYNKLLAVGLSYVVLVLLRNIPSISNLPKDFVMKAYCILSNAFSASF